MVDNLIYLSNPLFLFVLWIVVIMLAEDKEDPMLYMIQLAFGIPLGIYFLWLAETVNIIPQITGMVIVLISVYYTYLGGAIAVQRGFRK